jgi:hypothetical protein
MRAVNIERCRPVRLLDPKIGEPAVMIMMSYQGIPEQPICLRLPDVRMLCNDLTLCLARHGDQQARQIAQRCAEDGSVSKIGFQTDPHDQQPSQPVSPTANIQAMSIKITIRFDDRKLPPLRCQVVGGYRSSAATMLVLRTYDYGGVVDFPAKLMPENRIMIKGLANDEAINLYLFRNVHPRPIGFSFKVGRRIYVTLGSKEIRPLLKNKVFRIQTPPSPKPSPLGSQA